MLHLFAGILVFASFQFSAHKILSIMLLFFVSSDCMPSQAKSQVKIFSTLTKKLSLIFSGFLILYRNLRVFFKMKSTVHLLLLKRYERENDACMGYCVNCDTL